MTPWLSIIGIGEDGLNGLPPASRAELDAAEVVFGGPRHLRLAGIGAERAHPWPVPFSVAPVLAQRGRRVAVLASGDPFWHGAGGSLAAELEPGEWRAFPAPSTFSLIAARLGWQLEEVACLGLHAAPFDRLGPLMRTGGRAICLLRDGAAVAALADWLETHGGCEMLVCEAVGGPDEHMRACLSSEPLRDARAPVAVAINLRGSGLSLAPGRDMDVFAHDGQITKGPVRALTLAALAPRPGEWLWDIGAGSGSVSVEWCLAGAAGAHAIEARADRLANIRVNAARFALEDRLQIHHGPAPEALADLPAADAVFVGGGGSADLFEAIFARTRSGTRLVANAVTIETQALLAGLHGARGGQLLKIDLAEAAPLGGMRGWQAARTVVQWSVTR